MPSNMLLDTNAYFLLFKSPHGSPYHSLVKHLKHGSITTFFLPAIVALEIHSVIGKAKRGMPRQIHKCDRHDHLPTSGACSHHWITPGTKGISPRLFNAIQKMVKDVHEMRGSIQAKIIPLDQTIIDIASDLLRKYSDTCNLRSQDSIIAATAIYAKTNLIPDVSVATSDKVLKKVLSLESVPVFDPLKDKWS